jgi:hypothetical protein
MQSTNKCSTDISFHGDFQEGMKAFENGNFNKALSCFMLIDINSLGESSQNIFMSYLGLVHVLLDQGDGLKLCRRAVHLERFNGDLYYNLALAELESGKRQNAIEVLRSGLVIEPRHQGLTELHGKICSRKNPTLRFLSRNHLINRVLGKIRSHNYARKTAR